MQAMFLCSCATHPCNANVHDYMYKHKAVAWMRRLSGLRGAGRKGGSEAMTPLSLLNERCCWNMRILLSCAHATAFTTTITYTHTRTGVAQTFAFCARACMRLWTGLGGALPPSLSTCPSDGGFTAHAQHWHPTAAHPPSSLWSLR